MDICKLARYRTPQACTCILYTPGASTLRAVTITDGGVVDLTLPATEQARMRPVVDMKSREHGDTARMRMAAEFMLEAGERFGITKAAKEFLEAARRAVAEECLA